MKPNQYATIKLVVFVSWTMILGVIYFIIDRYTTVSAVFEIIYIWVAIASMIALQLIFKFVFDKKMESAISDREKKANKIIYIVVFVAVLLAICGGVTYALLT